MEQTVSSCAAGRQSAGAGDGQAMWWRIHARPKQAEPELSGPRDRGGAGRVGREGVRAGRGSKAHTHRGKQERGKAKRGGAFTRIILAG